jgi:amidase
MRRKETGMRGLWVGLAALAMAACATPPGPATDALAERSLAELSEDLAAGRTTSVALVQGYLDRIERIDRSGPTLQSVISLNPEALAQARMLDTERAAGRSRGPLHGVPVLLKDNIESRELPTTAGSLALAGNMTGRDAPMAARLREAGAILLGKTNLSEWANFRSTRSISGWSAVGGITRNPYALDRNTCGSSSGSGAAAAASLAAGTIGTETSGSVVCPSSFNGLVGLKPTVVLDSRTHVVPISHSMDTPGPMTRTVRDAAMLLTVIAGKDPADPATQEADARKKDYAAGLSADALRRKRLGVLRLSPGSVPAVDKLYDQALADLRAAGAELVEVTAPPDVRGVGSRIGAILSTEFKADLNAYLATTPAAVSTRTLADLIAFNAREAARQMPLFGQELFEQSEATKGLADPAYVEALAAARKLAGPEGIDRVLAAQDLDALVTPTMPPAWPTDPAGASRPPGGDVITGVPAVAGYPHLTVPMGLANGLPVGLSFVGTAWTEQELLAMGYAYEQASRRREPPRYLPSINVEAAFAPAAR